MNQNRRVLNESVILLKGLAFKVFILINLFRINLTWADLLWTRDPPRFEDPSFLNEAQVIEVGLKAGPCHLLGETNSKTLNDALSKPKLLGKSKKLLRFAPGKFCLKNRVQITQNETYLVGATDKSGVPLTDLVLGESQGDGQNKYAQLSLSNLKVDLIPADFVAQVQNTLYDRWIIFDRDLSSQIAPGNFFEVLCKEVRPGNQNHKWHRATQWKGLAHKKWALRVESSLLDNQCAEPLLEVRIYRDLPRLRGLFNFNFLIEGTPKNQIIRPVDLSQTFFSWIQNVKFKDLGQSSMQIGSPFELRVNKLDQIDGLGPSVEQGHIVQNISAMQSLYGFWPIVQKTLNKIESGSKIQIKFVIKSELGLKPVEFGLVSDQLNGSAAAQGWSLRPFEQRLRFGVDRYGFSYPQGGINHKLSHSFEINQEYFLSLSFDLKQAIYSFLLFKQTELGPSLLLKKDGLGLENLSEETLGFLFLYGDSLNKIQIEIDAN